MKIISELTFNTIYKYLRFIKISLKKNLKLELSYSDYPLILAKILIISLIETNTFIEEQSGKQGLVKIGSINNTEIGFILLAKMITIYIKLSKIKI